MKKLIQVVVSWAIVLACLFVTAIVVAVLKPTLNVWVILFVASLSSVLAAGVYLHVIRKRETEEFTLPGEAPPAARRERIPLLTMMIGLLLAAALMLTLPIILR